MQLSNSSKVMTTLSEEDFPYEAYSRSKRVAFAPNSSINSSKSPPKSTNNNNTKAIPRKPSPALRNSLTQKESAAIAPHSFEPFSSIKLSSSVKNLDPANNIATNDSMNKDFSSSLSRNSVEAKQYGATLKDLCPEDKARIGELMKKLAQEKEEKEALNKQMNQIKSNYENVIMNLQNEKNEIFKESVDIQNQFRHSLNILKGLQEATGSNLKKASPINQKNILLNQGLSSNEKEEQKIQVRTEPFLIPNSNKAPIEKEQPLKKKSKIQEEVANDLNEDEEKDTTKSQAQINPSNLTNTSNENSKSRNHVNKALEIEKKNQKDLNDIKKLKNEIEELAYSLKTVSFSPPKSKSQSKGNNTPVNNLPPLLPFKRGKTEKEVDDDNDESSDEGTEKKYQKEEGEIQTSPKLIKIIDFEKPEKQHNQNDKKNTQKAEKVALDMKNSKAGYENESSTDEDDELEIAKKWLNKRKSKIQGMHNEASNTSSPKTTLKNNTISDIIPENKKPFNQSLINPHVKPIIKVNSQQKNPGGKSLNQVNQLDHQVQTEHFLSKEDLMQSELDQNLISTENPNLLENFIDTSKLTPQNICELQKVLEQILDAKLKNNTQDIYKLESMNSTTRGKTPEIITTKMNNLAGYNNKNSLNNLMNQSLNSMVNPQMQMSMLNPSMQMSVLNPTMQISTLNPLPMQMNTLNPTMQMSTLNSHMQINPFKQTENPFMNSNRLDELSQKSASPKPENIKISITEQDHFPGMFDNNGKNRNELTPDYIYEEKVREFLKIKERLMPCSPAKIDAIKEEMMAPDGLKNLNGSLFGLFNQDQMMLNQSVQRNFVNNPNIPNEIRDISTRSMINSVDSRTGYAYNPIFQQFPNYHNNNNNNNMGDNSQDMMINTAKNLKGILKPSEMMTENKAGSTLKRTELEINTSTTRTEQIEIADELLNINDDFYDDTLFDIVDKVDSELKLNTTGQSQSIGDTGSNKYKTNNNSSRSTNTNSNRQNTSHKMFQNSMNKEIDLEYESLFNTIRNMKSLNANDANTVRRKIDSNNSKAKIQQSPKLKFEDNVDNDYDDAFDIISSGLPINSVQSRDFYTKRSDIYNNNKENLTNKGKMTNVYDKFKLESEHSIAKMKNKAKKKI